MTHSNVTVSGVAVDLAPTWGLLLRTAFRAVVRGAGAAPLLLSVLSCSSTGTTVGAGEDAELVSREVAVDTGPELRPDLRGDETGVDIPGDLAAEIELVEPGCQPGAGCFLDECSDNTQCQSGLCVEHLGEGVCTRLCEEECPSGWICKQVSGTGPDLMFACVSLHANLCRPCTNVDSCKSTGAEDACLDYGAEGAFCGSLCGEETQCPWGFTCKPALTIDGIEVSQCVADAGICPCTSKSVALGLWTACLSENELGQCHGKRVCGEGGLSACDAAVAELEVCNGKDDDCDDESDEADDVGGKAVALCDDGNDCTQDQCLGETGCEHAPLSEVECKDGNPCTAADVCKDGVCIGSPVLCDDSNPCTDDECDGKGGCLFAANTVVCDDKDPCTVGDTCKDEECHGYSVSCDCAKDADCGPLDDGNPCNGTLFCDTTEIPYQCRVDEATVVQCPAPIGPDAVCLDAVCDPGTGKCGTAAAHEGYPCENGDLCTSADTCKEGKCAAGKSLNCNDGNPCTDDGCAPDAGCIYSANAMPCSDGDTCTVGDVCGEGKCNPGKAADCNDGNPCTDDGCSAKTGCSHVPNKAPCDFANLCTQNDQCGDGWCHPGPVIGCDDGNVCTVDACEPETGCTHQPFDGTCSDGNPCTVNDACVGGKCVPGTAAVCNDGNPCTDDSCTNQGVCKFVPNQAPCSDGNPCTLGDHCETGSCKSTGLVSCDDANPCTDESCDVAAGCTYTLNQAPCSDGNPCTIGDACDQGMCQSGAYQDCDDGNPCTKDTCSPTGTCQHAAKTGGCDDGNACTQGDACVDGKCKPAGMLPCDDGSSCTTDSCDPTLGCVYAPKAGLCEDGNVCTLGDQCVGGKCVSGGLLVCNDYNLCTDDSCDPKSGCVFATNQVACDDSNACTVGDACALGQCTPGKPLDCDDGNLCTDDACDPKAGCIHADNASACDDKNLCTLDDHCKAGKCQDSTPLDCEDGNVCTDDSCLPAIGCQHAANTVSCNDGSACTANDKCALTKCVGSPVDCNDKKECTTDSCEAATGCKNAPVPDGTPCTELPGGKCTGGTCTPANPNLVLYYSFEEGAGKVLDHGAMGNATPAQFMGSTAYSNTAKYGSFGMKTPAGSGAADRLQIEGNISDLSMTVSYSFMAWVRITGGSGGRGVVMLGSCCNNRQGYTFSVNSNGTVRFWGGVDVANDNRNCSGSKNVKDGSWHHVGVRVKSGQVQILVDGVVDGSNGESNIPAYPNKAPYTDTNVMYCPQIGGYGIDNWTGFESYIDEVRVYSVWLNDAEWAAAMAGQ
ncbi:MAG: LamG domain-containing protein [Deltaproteobacteria bacterium]|nr:LamG domain-containing protein [Deltaproteobacteria bacterium]